MRGICNRWSLLLTCLWGWTSQFHRLLHKLSSAWFWWLWVQLLVWIEGDTSSEKGAVEISHWMWCCVDIVMSTHSNVVMGMTRDVNANDIGETAHVRLDSQMAQVQLALVTLWGRLALRFHLSLKGLSNSLSPLAVLTAQKRIKRIKMAIFKRKLSMIWTTSTLKPHSNDTPKTLIKSTQCLVWLEVV